MDYIHFDRYFGVYNTVGVILETTPDLRETCDWFKSFDFRLITTLQHVFDVQYIFEIPSHIFVNYKVNLLLSFCGKIEHLINHTKIQFAAVFCVLLK